jgi:hypothetical protein
MQGLIAVASSNDYLSMDVRSATRCGRDGANECLPTSLTLAKDNACSKRHRDTEPADRGTVRGIFVTRSKKQTGACRVYTISVGEGVIWISDEFGVVESGDLQSPNDPWLRKARC